MLEAAGCWQSPPDLHTFTPAPGGIYSARGPRRAAQDLAALCSRLGASCTGFFRRVGKEGGRRKLMQAVPCRCPPASSAALHTCEGWPINSIYFYSLYAKKKGLKEGGGGAL